MHLINSAQIDKKPIAMKSQKYTYIGCDISKAKIDINAGNKLRFVIKNAQEGFAELFEKIKKLNNPFLVLEHTGVYGEALCVWAQKKKIAFACVDSKRVREFAKSEGRRAKTDKLDAEIIRRFGEEKRPLAQQAITEERKRLRELRNAISILVKTNASLKIELETITEKSIRRSFQKIITHNEKQIARMEKQCLTLIRSNPQTAVLLDALLQIRGVGEKTALVLLTTLPELGLLSRQKLSALIGVAPLDDQSGKHFGKCYCYGGRSRPRTALYMASLVAIKDPSSHLGLFYRHLREKHKPFKVAIVACMRKLLIHINSTARECLKKLHT